MTRIDAHTQTLGAFGKRWRSFRCSSARFPKVLKRGKNPKERHEKPKVVKILCLPACACAREPLPGLPGSLGDIAKRRARGLGKGERHD